MGELLDRHLQREMLDTLAWSYPNSADVSETFPHVAENVTRVNLCYLGEHGLVSLQTAELDEGLIVTDAKITARGLDFLQDDGGLGAVLGVVTVKLHDETIKKLLSDKVRETVEDPTVRDRLLEAIKDLPAEATKRIAARYREAMNGASELVMGKAFDLALDDLEPSVPIILAMMKFRAERLSMFADVEGEATPTVGRSSSPGSCLA